MDSNRLSYGLMAGVFLFFLFTINIAAETDYPRWSLKAPKGILGKDIDNTTKVKVQNGYENLPLYFIKNNGQIDEKVKYYEKGREHSTYFTQEGVYLSLINQQYNCTQKDSRFMSINAIKQEIPVEEYLGLTFLDANQNPVIVAKDIQEGKVNYFIGNDSEKWKVNVPTYKNVSYKDIYKGIDMKFYGNNHCLEYDVIVKPGSDPSQVKFSYEGIKGMRISDEGNMEIVLNRGKLIHKAPYIYQEIDGERQEIKGKFIIHELISEDTINADSANEQYVFGFNVASYDKRYALIIDPVLTYSTYLGGSGEDVGLGIAVDESRYIYVTGHTASTNFPLSNAIRDTYGGGANDIFITKINADGSGLIYSTFLGGSGFDETRGGIDLDAAGNVYISGSTSSVDFPIFNAIQQRYGGGFSDAFVAKINSTGCALVYSTFLGGDNIEDGNSISVDNIGNAYIAGETASNNFPIFNAIQARKGSNPNATTTTKIAGNLNAEFDTGAVRHVLTGATSYEVSGVDAVDTDTLNNLDENTTNYVAGDSIHIVGTELDGTVAYSIFQWGAALDGTTLGDLSDFISASFGSATATISNGAIVLTADTPGVANLTLSISDSPGNTGATTHPGLSTTTTGSGDAYVTTIPLLDALGASQLVTLTFNKTAYNTWNLTPTMKAGEGTVVDAITAINFNNNGSFAYVTGTSSMTITYPDSTTQTVALDFGTPNTYGEALVQFGGTSSATQISQDGVGLGGLDAFVTKINLTGSEIVYSTFLGGSQDDGSDGISVDDLGNAYIVGETSSVDFPIFNAIQPNYGGGVEDAFVLKINPAGSALEYSTFLGGSGFDSGDESAVDSFGNAYVVGKTGSIDFPTVNAFQQNYGGGFSDAFITRINSDGSALVYSTFLGGNNLDDGNSISVDNIGNVYITGETASYDFPAVNAIQEFNDAHTPMATSTSKIAGNLDAEFSAGSDQHVLTSSIAYEVNAVAAVATDALNSLDLNSIDYVSGDTIDIVGSELRGTDVSAVFQWGAAFDGTTLGDLIDFVSASFGSATASLDVSGNLVLTADAPGHSSLSLTISDSSGNTGGTIHPDFATITNGSGDVYITTIPIFDTLGASQLVTLTFNKTASNTWDVTPTMRAGDGTVSDAITAITFNNNGSFSSITGTSAITITYPDSTTQTVTLDFGIPNTFDEALVQFGGTSGAASISQDGNGYGLDAFVSKVDPTGSTIIYSTFLGGSHREDSNTITVDNFGNAYIIGNTYSSDFPTTTGSYDTCFNGDGDVFVTKLSIEQSKVTCWPERWKTWKTRRIIRNRNRRPVKWSGRLWRRK